MISVLKCVRSNNENFTEGRRYLFINGILTCDTNGFSSNIYITDLESDVMKFKKQYPKWCKEHYPLSWATVRSK